VQTAVLVKATMMTAVFWGITPYILVQVYRRFGEEAFSSINKAYEILDCERERTFFSLVKCPHHFWSPTRPFLEVTGDYFKEWKSDRATRLITLLYLMLKLRKRGV